MRILYTLLLPLLFSCNNWSADEVNEDTVENKSVLPDSALDNDTSNLGVNTRPPEGIYQVILPCADCKGLEHTVYFHPDLSYQLEEKRLGKKTGVTKFSGNWKPENGEIVTYKSGTVAGRYKWKGLNLLYITGNNEYSLQKRTSISENETWKKKMKSGSEFFGVGNEPFWNVEIDEDKEIRFHLAEWSEPMIFKAAQPVVSADSVLYQTDNDSLSLRITIYSAFCSDGMSDNMYPSQVKVFFNKQTYTGCGMMFQ